MEGPQLAMPSPRDAQLAASQAAGGGAAPRTERVAAALGAVAERDAVASTFNSTNS